MPSHLKEQDELFQFILQEIKAQGVMSPAKYGACGPCCGGKGVATHPLFVVVSDAVFSKVEDMISAHIEAPEGSELSK